MSLGSLVRVVILPLFFATTSCAQHEEKSHDAFFLSEHEGKSGWLGVSIQDMSARTAKRMKVKTDAGALVNNVSEESPASKAGVLDDDIIIEFDGRTIRDSEDLVNAVRKTDPGKKVNLAVMRGDKKMTLQVEVGKTPRRKERVFHIGPGEGSGFVWSSRSGIGGLGLMNLNRQLARYFEVPDGRGVLVEEVEEGTPAAKAGFAAGDVIISIGKDRVHDTGDIDWALEDRKEGETVDVTVVRKGAKKTLAVPVTGEGSRKAIRFKRKIVVPEPPDIDIDIEDFDEPEGLLQEHKFHQESLRRSAENLRVKMEDLGKSIREQTAKIRTRVLRLIRDV